MDKSVLNYLKTGIAVGVIGILIIYANHNLIMSSEINNAQYRLVVSKENTTWNFKIYRHKHLIIKQDYIPVIQGNQPFKSKEDTKKIGELMIRKLKHNKSPTITYQELKSNNIKFNTLAPN